jgi:uncharacterized membrane protein YcfT
MVGTPAAPPATTGERVTWVDAGRGIAILLVAIYHATNWLAGTGLELDFWTDVTRILSSLRMPFFFILAGLFAPKWLNVRWRELLRAKVALFAWVFAVWQTIGILVFPLGLLSHDKPVGVGGLLKALLLSPVLPRFELWFIWALAIFFVLAKATRHVDPRVQLAVAGLVSAVGLTLWADFTTGWSGSVKFYFFFLAGLYARRSVLTFGEKSRSVVLVAAFGTWGAVSVAVFVLELRDVPGLYFLNCALGVLAGVAVSRALRRIGWLAALGRQTLPIYLAHAPLIIGCAFVVSKTALPGLTEPLSLLVPPVVTVLAVTGSLALHHACIRIGASALYQPPGAVLRRIEPRVRAAR